MNKPMIFSAAGVLLLSSMQLHADAMGEGLGFAVAPQAQAGASASPAMKTQAPLSSLKVGLPETWPEPQCVGSDQPCAEQAQQANNQAKNKDKAPDK